MIKVDVQSVKQRFGIVGNSPLLDREIEKALLIAPIDLSVLIIGESGVGKEVFPQFIHQNSIRKHKQYIAVNCGAIPEGTINSELFGHEKGSFTGAIGERKGYFEVADGGTLFLDEAAELPLTTQAHLLRILETGEYLRVGSSKVQKTDVRVVAATNVNIIQQIRNGKFREDLYYRLNSVPLHIPSLRERKEDIPLLFRKFASDFAEKYKMPPVQLTPESKQVLMEYHWPGNIRELKNITERISVFEQEREISVKTLKTYLTHAGMDLLPALVGNDQRSFNSEREILYQVLFDLKKDVTDLKKIVHEMMSDKLVDPSEYTSLLTSPKINPELLTFSKNITPIIDDKNDDELYAEAYEEEAISLEEMEKDMIKKSLERHGGKRKNAALDLKISERTLYRKIKEYGLE